MVTSIVPAGQAEAVGGETLTQRWASAREALGLANDGIRLAPGVRRRLVVLAEERLDFVGWKCVEEGTIPARSVRVAEREFRRFMALVVLGYSPLGMLGRVVDEFWHQFIIFTREYAAFCTRVFGFFVHHQPDTPVSRVPGESGVTFVESYRRHFGELPPIWFERMPEVVRKFYSQPTLIGDAPRWASAWVSDPASIERSEKPLPRAIRKHRVRR